MVSENFLIVIFGNILSYYYWVSEKGRKIKSGRRQRRIQRSRRGRNTKRRESRVPRGRRPREVPKYRQHTCVTNCQISGHSSFTRSAYNYN